VRAGEDLMPQPEQAGAITCLEATSTSTFKPSAGGRAWKQRRTTGLIDKSETPLSVRSSSLPLDYPEHPILGNSERESCWCLSKFHRGRNTLPSNTSEPTVLQQVFRGRSYPPHHNLRSNRVLIPVGINWQRHNGKTVHLWIPPLCPKAPH
jgi:hypothetical protein